MSVNLVLRTMSLYSAQWTSGWSDRRQTKAHTVTPLIGHSRCAQILR